MKKVPHRILCWDDKYIEQSENVQIQAHQPEKKNIALTCDNEWEGVHNGYASVMKVGETYRLYYRADSFRHRIDKAVTAELPSVSRISENMNTMARRIIISFFREPSILIIFPYFTIPIRTVPQMKNLRRSPRSITETITAAQS